MSGSPTRPSSQVCTIHASVASASSAHLPFTQTLRWSQKTTSHTADNSARLRAPAGQPGSAAAHGGMVVRGCGGGHPKDVLAALAGAADQLSQTSGQGYCISTLVALRYGLSVADNET